MENNVTISKQIQQQKDYNKKMTFFLEWIYIWYSYFISSAENLPNKCTHTHFSYQRRPANFHHTINGLVTQRILLVYCLQVTQTKQLIFV